jgi:hypothetical protein
MLLVPCVGVFVSLKDPTSHLCSLFFV